MGIPDHRKCSVLSLNTDWNILTGTLRYIYNDWQRKQIPQDVFLHSFSWCLYKTATALVLAAGDVEGDGMV